VTPLERQEQALAEVKAVYGTTAAGERELDRVVVFRWAMAHDALTRALAGALAAEVALRIDLGYSQVGLIMGKPVVRRVPAGEDDDELESLL
jgi:hypothetical protein